MTSRRFRVLRQEIEAFRRRGGVKSRELVKLAKKIGRTPADRGSEPTYDFKTGTGYPGARPLAIPWHSKDLRPGTANNILDQLEEDVEQLEERFIREQANGASKNGCG